MTHFVFCHGFGFDPHFWERISPFFSKENCSFIDLGYFNNKKENKYLENEAIIGIGHSMGLSKLLSMCSNFDCLIGLNGFVNFLGSHQAMYQKRQKELKALRSSFLKDADTTLRKFYVRCAVPQLLEYNDLSKLDVGLIVSDLQWLQKEYELPDVPTLILSSSDDVVVPRSVVLDNFRKQPRVKLDSIMDAGHALGFRKPREVYEKIMSFLDDRTA